MKMSRYKEKERKTFFFLNYEKREKERKREVKKKGGKENLE